MIPEPWEFALLALAAYRTWKLVGDDAITEPLRRRYVEGHEWRETFVACPWCAGFWVTLAWVAAWWLAPYGTLIAAVPLALSAAVGSVAVAVNALAD